jgi:hypothetical protein
MALCGAPQVGQVTAEDQARVNGLTAAINAQSGTNHESYTVVAASTQVVAGTNYFYHLNGNPGNSPLTVTIYEPLPHTGEPAQVSQVSVGHNALQNGHGQ